MKKVVTAACLALFLASGASAQDFPTKQVTVIVPYSKGSATDNFARMVGEQLSARWKQPVVVDNLPGPAGKDAVAKAAPDGYTLFVDSSSYVIGPAMSQAQEGDPFKALVEIAAFARQPFALVVGPTAGVKSVSELVAAAKAKAGEMKYGSPGFGSAAHLVAERFSSVAGFKARVAQYKGGPEVNVDTTAGVVTYWFAPVAMAVKDVKEGRLTALAVTSSKRSGVLPDVPTMAEAGVKGFEDAVWWGLWAPANISASAKARLVKDVAGVLSVPELREKFLKIGAEPLTMTPEEFSKFVRAEYDATARIVKEAGIKPQQ